MLVKVQKAIFLQQTFHMTCCVHDLQDQREKLQNHRIMTEFFDIAAHTQWECQAVHKIHDFGWNDPTVLSELHDVFERRTPSIANQVSDIPWISLQSAFSLSSKGGNAARKTVDRRSGDTPFREICLADNEKQGENFVETPPTQCWVFSLRVVVSLTLKPERNARSVIKEKKWVERICQQLWSTRETAEKDQRET